MVDRLPRRPRVLRQILDIASERWRHWDERLGEQNAAGLSEAGAQRSKGPGGASAERSGTSATIGSGAPRPRSPITAAERRRAVRMRGQGRTLREIGLSLNRSESTIRRILYSEPSRDSVTRSEFRALDERVARIESMLASFGTALHGLDGGRAASPRRRRQTEG